MQKTNAFKETLFRSNHILLIKFPAIENTYFLLINGGFTVSSAS